MLNWHGRALADLAEVLALAGRREEAAAELSRAIELYGRKGNAVAEAKARSRLAESPRDGANRLARGWYWGTDGASIDAPGEPT